MSDKRNVCREVVKWPLVLGGLGTSAVLCWTKAKAWHLVPDDALNDAAPPIRYVFWIEEYPDVQYVHLATPEVQSLPLSVWWPHLRNEVVHALWEATRTTAGAA